MLRALAQKYHDYHIETLTHEYLAQFWCNNVFLTQSTSGKAMLSSTLKAWHI